MDLGMNYDGKFTASTLSISTLASMCKYLIIKGCNIFIADFDNFPKRLRDQRLIGCKPSEGRSSGVSSDGRNTCRPDLLASFIS